MTILAAPLPSRRTRTVAVIPGTNSDEQLLQTVCFISGSLRVMVAKVSVGGREGKVSCNCTEKTVTFEFAATEKVGG